MITEYKLDQEENLLIDELTKNILQKYHSPENEEFLSLASLLAHDLPIGLKKFLHSFKEQEDKYSACKVSGYNIDDTIIGKTPLCWEDKLASSHLTIQESIYLVLCGSLIGYPIAWATQQEGFVVHDIFPIEKHRNSQLGFSSDQQLEWHTEDAFHPLRGDYLAIMGLRNHDKIPTLICTTNDIDLTQKALKPLFNTTYRIKPDESHLFINQSQSHNDERLKTSQNMMQEQNINLHEIAVLFGNPINPYWRLDPYFMEMPNETKDKEALELLIKLIDENIKPIVIDAGEILFCDNYRVVHGRGSFNAKFDGTDRWLKRLNIVNDLRKSRASRKSAKSRILY